MCTYNQMIKNRKYTKNKKNQQINPRTGDIYGIPTLPDRRVEYVPTACGNCMECRKQKAREWMVRLLEDIKTNTNGKFIVLTFSNEAIQKILTETITKTDKKTGAINKIQLANLKGYERDNAIATKGVRIFNEQWRYKHGKSPRHWLITELGHNGTENIHLHGIIWTNETIEEIRTMWKWGYIWPKPWDKRPNYINQQSISYFTKYVHKVDQRHKEYKPIILCSPGIGSEYVNTLQALRNVNQQTETYKTSTGHEIALPTYWRKKVFSDEDRERLWIKRLDKQERWVDGIKYDISKTDKDYKKAVQEARRKSVELGYTGRPNENRKAEEEAQREIMIQTRLKAAEKITRIPEWQMAQIAQQQSGTK